MEPCPSIPSIACSVSSSSILVPDIMTGGSNFMTRNSSVSSQSEARSAHSPEKTRSSSKRVLIMASISVLILLMMLTSLVVVLFIQVADLRNRLNAEISSHSKDFGEVCLPCGELKMGPFEDDNPDMAFLEKERIGDKEICCAKSPNQTKILFDLLYLKKQMQEQRHDMLQAEQIVETPPKHNSIYAHLLVGGVQNTSTAKGQGPYRITNWSANHHMGVISGMSFQNDRLHINASGLYFIYSQVYFDRMCDQGLQNTGSSEPLFHYVYRFNYIYPNGGDQLLMKTVRTPCQNQRNEIHGDYTSYTAGAIRMTAGDQLYVMVSNLKMVSPVSEASFLGAFKIG